MNDCPLGPWMSRGTLIPVLYLARHQCLDPADPGERWRTLGLDSLENDEALSQRHPLLLVTTPLILLLRVARVPLQPLGIPYWSFQSSIDRVCW